MATKTQSNSKPIDDYFRRFDAHLATLGSAKERAAVIDEQITFIDRLERRLDAWAARNGSDMSRPTQLNAWELGTLSLELNTRLAIARDQMREAA